MPENILSETKIKIELEELANILRTIGSYVIYLSSEYLLKPYFES